MADVKVPTNALTWFEIPVTDLERATRYYEQLFEVSLTPWKTDDKAMAMFPCDQQAGGVGGALIQANGTRPADHGTVIYLNATGRLDECVARAGKHGGKVVVPRTDIGDPGFIAMIEDPDGNRVGLHSPR